MQEGGGEEGRVGRKGCNLIGVFYGCGDRGLSWFGKAGGIESTEESLGGPRGAECFR